MVEISYFDLFCLLVGLVSLMITIIQSVRKSDLIKSLENQLIAIIGNLDSLCVNAASEKTTKEELHAKSIAVRGQAIGALKSFSKLEERHPTYDFGIKEGTAEERAKKRKETMGIDIDGCVISRQDVMLIDGSTSLIDDLLPSMELLSYEEESHEFALTNLKKEINKYTVKNYIQINGQLKLTGEHKVFCKDRGWIEGYALTIGDALLKHDGRWERVEKIELIDEERDCYSVHLFPYECFFVSGYLVHNEEEEGK